MFRVLFAKYRMVCRYAPVDAKAVVEDADAPVRFGMVELIALVLEHRRLAQHGETVGEALRDEELPVVVLRQLHGHVPAVSRAALADVHRHVEHGTLDASHQLGLRERRTLEVQAAHHAVGGHALVVLHELHAADLLLKLPAGIALEEVSALVLEDTWLNDDHALYLRLYYFHSS